MSHARLSPSNHRWVHCPGSLREEAVYPDTSSEAAIDGTGSHLLLELCLTADKDIQEYLGEIIGVNHEDKPNGWTVNQERIDRVKMCLDYLARRKKTLVETHPGSTVTVDAETRSNPGRLYNREDWWGTVDITLSVWDKDENCVFVEVVDYKDGRGYVDEKNNPQLVAYLGGKINVLCEGFNNPKRIHRYTIVQPKTSTPVRYSVVNEEGVKNSLDQLAKAAFSTDDPDAPLIPDNKGGKGYCKYCSHKTNCAAMKNELKGGIEMLENEGLNELLNSSKKLSEMDSEDLTKIYEIKSQLEKLLSDVKEELETRIKNGNHVPGWGMVPGNSKKQWNVSEEELTKFLRNRGLKKDQVYIAKLISPAQALKHEDLTKKQKEKLEELIEVVPGKSTLGRVKQEEVDTVDLFKEVSQQEISFI